MVFSVVGIAILAAGGFWLFGGVVLRVGGIFLAGLGAVSLALMGEPIALFLVAFGFVMWLVGHWHFAYRHHVYKSPLARRIFLEVLPPRYDPTRNWGVPVAPQEPVDEPLAEEPREP
jgi:type IV secretory pathway TrbD component